MLLSNVNKMTVTRSNTMLGVAHYKIKSIVWRQFRENFLTKDDFDMPILVGANHNLLSLNVLLSLYSLFTQKNFLSTENFHYDLKQDLHST